MTLNGVIALILRFLLNSIALQADYVTVVKDRSIISVKYCLPVPVFHFLPKLMHLAVAALCAIAEHPVHVIAQLPHYAGSHMHNH